MVSVQLSSLDMVCKVQKLLFETLSNSVKQGSVYFVICTKQGPKNGGCSPTQDKYFRAFFCPKQGQGFRPSVAPLYPNMDQVPSPSRGSASQHPTLVHIFVADQF